MKIRFVIVFVLTIYGCKIFSDNPTFKFETILSGLYIPWELQQLDSNIVIFTQRNGLVYKLNLATKEKKLILKVPDVLEWGEGGLLGMAIHPEFPSVPHIFIVYNYGNYNSYKEKVVRYRFENDSLIEPVVILDNIKASSIHNGARLWITNDKKLLITTGDASNQSLSQDTLALNGKLLRVNLDGSVPEDNPFHNEVWSFGHRNAQGLVMFEDKIFISEHGPETDDEINLIRKGGNYGWPYVRGYCDDNYPNEKIFCQNNNVIEPLLSLFPKQTLAVCGLDFYNGNKFPQLNNSLLLVTLKTGLLLQLLLNESRDRIVKIDTIINNNYGRLRIVRVLKDGKIIIGTSNGSNDKLILISPDDNSLLNEEFQNKDPQISIDQATLKINLSYSNLFNTITIYLYDILGRKILEQNFDSEYIEISKPIVTTTIGFYILQINYGGSKFIRKLIW